MSGAGASCAAARSAPSWASRPPRRRPRPERCAGACSSVGASTAGACASACASAGTSWSAVWPLFTCCAAWRGASVAGSTTPELVARRDPRPERAGASVRGASVRGSCVRPAVASAMRASRPVPAGSAAGASTVSAMRSGTMRAVLARRDPRPERAGCSAGASTAGVAATGASAGVASAAGTASAIGAASATTGSEAGASSTAAAGSAAAGAASLVSAGAAASGAISSAGAVVPPAAWISEIAVTSSPFRSLEPPGIPSSEAIAWSCETRSALRSAVVARVSTSVMCVGPFPCPAGRSPCGGEPIACVSAKAADGLIPSGAAVGHDGTGSCRDDSG
ncbi:hypothetical protein CMMCA002_06275 [Clavibacter michiganensis subsp. michiganensis]|nr:hypothetical protein CMMCA002_06275 [Clavibacter michiganensis subsp. michiganensis]